MDFETYSEPIPEFQGTKPYAQIPFQYSVDILENGKVEHKEFLGEPGHDCRLEFLQKLLVDVGDSGLIITYNEAFELTRLRELSEAFPQYSDAILKLMVRIRDLMIPFRSMKIYSPKLKGSYSLKAVLPAFIEKLSYSGLAISDGGTAAAEFRRMSNKGISKATKNAIRENLLAYCKTDTQALVEVWLFVKSLIVADTKRLNINLIKNSRHE